MTTRKKSKAVQLLEGIAGGPLTIGGLLEAIRLGEEVSQVDFASTLGISRAQLCDIEKGRRNVSVNRAAAWARMLGYSETQFIRLALEQMVADAGLKVKITVEAA